MPTLTVDLTELDITVTPEARGWVEAVDSLGNPLPVVATAGTGLAFAARALEFSTGGVATIVLPSTADLEPAGTRYRVYLTRADAVTVPIAVGPFAFTASAGLHEVAELPPADVVSALNTLLDGAETSLGLIRDQAVLARDAAIDARDRAEAAADTASAGSSALIVVSGGTVDLPDAHPDGWLVGYRVTAPTTIEGMSFAPGSYVFERDSAVASGWTYRTLAASDPLTPAGGDTTAPTAPTLTVDNSAPTQLVATFSGGTDAVGVTQYRSRIDAGAWTVGASPRTFTGLTASTSYTIDVQAGDAAGNWSPSATWTGSTAAASLTPAAVGSLYAHYDASASSALTISTGTSVSAWNDQGANNLDLVAATAQPEQVTLNGLPAVQFTAASSDRMRYVGGFALPTTPGFTVCGVIRCDSSTQGYAVSSVNGNLNLQSADFIFANGSVYAVRPRPATGTAVFFAAVVDAAGVTFRIGSSTTTTAGTTTALGSNFSLGGFYSGAGSDFTDVTVGETWVHNTALTGGQLDSLHAYAQAKWGVA